MNESTPRAEQVRPLSSASAERFDVRSDSRTGLRNLTESLGIDSLVIEPIRSGVLTSNMAFQGSKIGSCTKD